MRTPTRFADFAIWILLATVALSTAVSGQTSLAPVAATPPPAPTAPSTTPLPASNTPLQQRVLKSDGRVVAVTTDAGPERSANKNSPLTLHLLVGQSKVIDTVERLRRVYVANPAVLDSLTSRPNQIVLTAKLAGSSSVVLWSQSGRSQLYTVLADLDVADLKESLAQALPGDHVEVKAAEGRVCLSGVVGSDAAAEEAVRLAATYSKEVVNSLVVDPRHIPQVELKVRIAEVDRTKFEEFGLNFFSVGKNAGSVTTGGYTPPSFPQVAAGATQTLIQDALNIFYFNSDLNLGLTLRDLQDKGILQVLAEPNLTTISGRPAKFLAGRGIPLPRDSGFERRIHLSDHSVPALRRAVGFHALRPSGWIDPAAGQPRGQRAGLHQRGEDFRLHHPGHLDPQGGYGNRTKRRPELRHIRTAGQPHYGLVEQDPWHRQHSNPGATFSFEKP
jgi:Flp pilus assembly secretin CpaC